MIWFLSCLSGSEVRGLLLDICNLFLSCLSGSEGAHLLIHLMQIGWLKFVLLSALAIAPALERATQHDIQNERARRTRREYQLSAKITTLHTGGTA